MNLSFEDPRTVGPRIRMMMPHLTPLEARVVDMILGRRDFDGAMPLKTIADDAGVSEAMIIKIVKKLGFSGFGTFARRSTTTTGCQRLNCTRNFRPKIQGGRSH